MAPIIRMMTASDAAAVASLTQQLGYQVSALEIAERLGMVHEDERSVAFVAEADGEVVGWIQALNRVLLQWKRVLEIGGLVIDQDRRGERIGAQLVEAVSQWARQNGHTTLFVRSNVVREGAHDFYPALGFSHWKTSHTYVMELE